MKHKKIHSAKSKPMKTALITGASSGIGLEFAHLFAKDHYNLVLVARRENKLKEITQDLVNDYGIKVTNIPMDLVKENASRDLYNMIKEKKITIDVLINNAGYGQHGAFKDTDWKTEQNMILLNITTLTDLTKRFVKDMLKRNEGKILNLSSTAAFYPGPNMAVYYATKAYVQSFTVALSHELKDTGITVSVLSPGPTDTEFQERAGVENAALFSANMGLVATAREVAKAGYKGLMNGKTVIIPGVFNKLSAWSSGITPGFISKRLIASLHD
jgi:short-subunit dehydrogenase